MTEYDSVLQKISVTADSMKVLQAWLGQFPVIDMSKRDRDGKWQHLGLQDEECALTSFDDSAWRIMKLPTYWERTDVGNSTGSSGFVARSVSPPGGFTGIWFSSSGLSMIWMPRSSMGTRWGPTRQKASGTRPGSTPSPGTMWIRLS